MTDYTKLCEELRNKCVDCTNCLQCTERDGLGDSSADAIEDLQAESAEKDKRIAELEAENAELKKRIVFWNSGMISTLEKENARLQAERDAAVAVSEELREDFQSYATGGVPNPSPYCAKKNNECVDGRGWCVNDKCTGFVPSAYRGVREGEK